MLPARFWKKVQKSAGSGCWVWTGALSDGYGLFWWKGSTVAAHRLLFAALNGPIPDGQEIDHKCRNRRCVRPSHLRLVTHRENVRVGQGFCGKNSRKLCCAFGHRYTTKKNKNRVQRYCPTCAANRRSARARALRLAKWSALWDGLAPSEPAVEKVSGGT